MNRVLRSDVDLLHCLDRIEVPHSGFDLKCPRCCPAMSRSFVDRARAIAGSMPDEGDGGLAGAEPKSEDKAAGEAEAEGKALAATAPRRSLGNRDRQRRVSREGKWTLDRRRLNLIADIAAWSRSRKSAALSKFALC